MKVDVPCPDHQGKGHFDLVAVHGLYSSSSQAWSDGDSPSPTWLTKRLNEKGLAGRVLLYSYDGNISTAQGLCTRQGIQRAALELLTQVVESRKDQNPPLPLVFVSSDFGSLIIKEALTLASMNGVEFANIKACTRLLAFIGSPHRWTDAQDLEDKVTKFIMSKAPGTFKGREAKRLATTTASVASSFLHTRMLIRATIVNVYSTVPGSAEVSDSFTATFSTPMELLCGIETPSLQLKDEKLRDALFETMGKGVSRVTEFPWIDDAFSQLADVCESLAAPVYPLSLPCNTSHPYSWLEDDKTFRDWISDRGCSILHIHGNPNVSQAAEYGFHKTLSIQCTRRSNNNIHLYFKFNRYDKRRYHVSALATTFLAQILSRFRAPTSSYGRTFEPPLCSQSLTGEDAFFLLRSIKADLGTEARMTWVVDGLDECDPTSSQWLLSQFLDMASRSEVYFKLLITTAENLRIHETLANVKFSSIDLRSFSQPIAPNAGALADTLCQELLSECPEFQPFSAEVRKIFQACEPDNDFPRLMQNWLLMGNWTTSGSIEKELQILSPPSQTRFFQRILETVPAPARVWGRTVIIWALYSLRPLRPQELASVLSLRPGTVACINIVSEIYGVFGPLFVTVNDEIHFSSPLVRKFLSSTENATRWYTSSSADGHREIATTCIRYLGLPEIQKRVSEASHVTENSILLPGCGRDVASYAIQFWPTHYTLGCTTPPEDITNFLRDTEALQIWHSAYWHFCPPHLRSAVPPSHHLLTLASIGLGEEVSKVVASLSPLSSRDQLVPGALCEAARNGQQRIVDQLLALQYNVSSADVLRAMEAAAGSAEYGILKTLFSYLTSKDQKTTYSWPCLVLRRAAWAGETSLLKCLLRYQHTSNTKAPTDSSWALYCAAAVGNVRAVEEILKHGANINLHDETRSTRTALHAAVRAGCGATVRALAVTVINSKDGYERTALEQATILGHHQAMSALLEAGADAAVVESPLNRSGGQPSFHYVCSVSYETCVRLLLEHGVNPNAQYGPEEPPALVFAVRSGNVGICCSLLDHGAQVDGTQYYRPLIQALETDGSAMEVLELLVERGADVDISLRSGGTVLMHAARSGFKDVVKFLVEKGAIVNTTAKLLKTPLSEAARNGHTEIVKILMNAGADHRVSLHRTNWTPLHEAHAHPECLRALLDGGAEIDAPSNDSTALYLAAFHGKLQSVKLLVSRGANLEVTCVFPGLYDSEFTPLLAAAREGHYDIVRTLLEAGANIKARGPNDETPLYLAVTVSSEPTVKVLLEYDIDLDARAKDGRTAIFAALDSTDALSLTKLLVKRGASLQIQSEGYMPLDYSIWVGDTPLVEYLISAGAELNVTGNKQGGPLHAACFYLKLEIVKLLVAKGADANLVDMNLGTPLLRVFDRASESHSTSIRNIVPFLIDEAGANVKIHGGFLWSPLHAACLYATLDLVTLLIEHGAEVDDADTLGRRPIHHATFRTIQHVEQLLSAGVDTQVRDKLGRTILHTAVSSGRLEVVEKCLSITSGLVNDPDRDGWTPLHWAIRPSYHHEAPDLPDQVPIIKLLLAKGADLCLKGRYCGQEWSALRLARYYGASKELTSLLIPRQYAAEKDGYEGPLESLEAWNALAHFSPKGKLQDGFCDACLCTAYGLVYANMDSVSDLWLCGKCYPYRDEFFPDQAGWVVYGDEFDTNNKADEIVKDNEAGDPARELLPPVQQVQGSDDDDYEDWSDSDVN